MLQRKKTQKKKPLKALTKKQWRVLADTLWAKIVKDRAGRACALCGSTFMLEAHHMIAKGGCGYLRYSLENGLCLCRVCHFRFHNIDSQAGWDWLRENRPDDYEYISSHKKKVCPTKSIGYYRDVIAFLEAAAKEELCA